MSTPLLVFSLPFSKGMGFGHLSRQSTVALVAQQRGYKTVLLSDGNPADLSGRALELYNTAFDIKVPLTDLPMRADLLHIKDHGTVAGVIVDDGRKVGERADSLQALKDLGGVRVMIDWGHTSELDWPDKIVNFELGLPSYPPSVTPKLIVGGQYAFLSADLFAAAALPKPLPQPNPVLIMFGATDPLNVASGVIKALKGLPVSPVLVAPHKSPHAQHYHDALREFPASLWFDNNLTRGQLYTLIKSVQFSIIAPASNTCYYHLGARTPFVAIETNPTLKANTAAVGQMGLPAIHLDEHKVNGHWGTVASVDFPQLLADIPAAYHKLEAAGYLAQRLPDAAPFKVQLDTHGPERMLEAAGLHDLVAQSVKP